MMKASTDDELTAARKLHRGATPSNPDRVVVLCDDERIPQICGSEEAVEPPGDNVVRPAIHRTAIVRHKSAEGDPKAEKLGHPLQDGAPDSASLEDKKWGAFAYCFFAAGRTAGPNRPTAIANTSD
jgi:hypothetical protein